MPVPTLITDLSTTISSNSPAGSDVVTPSTGPDDYMRAQSAFIAQLHSLKATIASPTFTGVPAGPTAAAGTSTTQLATTAFAQGAGFPSGTRMLFQQTSAPTGWTKDTSGTLDNAAMRIVTGGAGTGGAAAFTSVFASRTPTGSVSVADHVLTWGQMPIHSHATPGFQITGGPHTVAVFGNGARGDCSTGTGSAGADHPHNHGGSFTGSAMDFAVKYVDSIVATKN